MIGSATVVMKMPYNSTAPKPPMPEITPLKCKKYDFVSFKLDGDKTFNNCIVCEYVKKSNWIQVYSLNSAINLDEDILGFIKISIAVEKIKAVIHEDIFELVFLTNIKHPFIQHAIEYNLNNAKKKSRKNKKSKL